MEYEEFKRVEKRTMRLGGRNKKSEHWFLMRSTPSTDLLVILGCIGVKKYRTREGIPSSVNSQRVAVLVRLSAAVLRISAGNLHVNLRFHL